MSSAEALIRNIIRPDIQALGAYHIPSADGMLKLDAMENPYPLPDALQAELGALLAQAALNRYPVPSYSALKERICAKLGVPPGYGVILGNGSDELITMLSVACARGARGAMPKMLAPVPAFVMYALSAQLAGLEFIGVPLKTDFTLDKAALLAALAEHKPALLYLAYPNNPTGNLYGMDDMLDILRAAGDSTLVVVDEAYHPFAQTSFMPLLPEFGNLLVMRTVSKLGLAGIRLGYMSAAPALLDEFEKVRAPYNINVLTEAAACFALDHIDVLDAQAAALRAARGALAAALAALPGVESFPSAANFLLLRVADGDRVHAGLLERKVLIKNVGRMHPLLKNCLRVTVSTPAENLLFLEALKAALAE